MTLANRIGADLGTYLCSLISTEVANEAAGDVILGVRAAFWFSGGAGLTGKQHKLIELIISAVLLALIGRGRSDWRKTFVKSGHDKIGFFVA
jgi:hypothetical protein